mmetsp:Transcript_17479/g.29987  ORF Transcript_17479/g.29987 Transcript_17479/m.29987 type:complete len:529 (+) Transcript_17479:45-1631(+)|eukprot:CAMPEP_0119108690 /NCGR_PEP_ID=MMETSP1180-20130426/15603_1 /TAXON_ID=3052 ORGANISM="Chlamydomonas cf sp, Strain CCMP681" /NCGR_SAMPLE_ID=MMETSP1180 /ASSEMBLY_ACC=CAM_ASM_000741 /LENGTH=528 /DNA_ID=CAMNT_0007094335 /DNA_START=43 /DNA_END=1629 /DNA_ORIENTATION=+
MNRGMFGSALLLSLLVASTFAARTPSDLQSLFSAEVISGDHDLIGSLPGYEGNLKVKMHAGHISVGTGGKRLFYLFAEAQSNPSTAPVVLWMNGGPGCSSMDGFVYEHGPFNYKLVTEGGAGRRKGSPLGVELTDNPSSWNTVANVLYLDSPAGVGLSYSTDGDADYVTDDFITRDDAEEFLRKWFDTHPAFQRQPFYVSGESYAGVYVPNLALAVAEGNEKGSEPHINLQGILVGNGCTDAEVDGNALPAFVSGKSLIPQTLMATLGTACACSAASPVQECFWNTTGGSRCDKLLSKVWADVARLNIYDVLEDCFMGPNPDMPAHELVGLSLEGRAVAQQLQKLKPSNQMPQALASHGRRWPVVGSTPQGKVQNWAHLKLTPPCTDSRAAWLWLNDPAVRQALNAEPVEVSGEWALCSDRIDYTRVIPSLIPTHKALLRRGLRTLIFTGDHDMAVPHTGSERWTSELGLPVKKEWRPWTFESQVAGYVVEYAGLTYATVKGAGHMVPMNKPGQALAMFSRFLDGASL